MQYKRLYNIADSDKIAVQPCQMCVKYLGKIDLKNQTYIVVQLAADDSTVKVWTVMMIMIDLDGEKQNR